MFQGSEKPAAPVASSQNGESDHRISLVRGGPFYRVQKGVRLIDARHWNPGRRITVAVALAWVPLIILTAVFNPQALRGLLGDYPVNVRVFSAIPLLLAGQQVMDGVLSKIVRQVGDTRILTPSDTARLDKTLVTLIRLRDSALPEVVIVFLVYVRMTTGLRSNLAFALPWALFGTGTSAHISTAGWYYGIVSLLFYQFLLYISIWKWFLWTGFLFRLSRLDLQLVPTHPDSHGGLGFLGMSPVAIAPSVFVAAAAIGGPGVRKSFAMACIC
jgi:hypothetical protein